MGVYTDAHPLTAAHSKAIHSKGKLRAQTETPLGVGSRSWPQWQARSSSSHWHPALVTTVSRSATRSSSHRLSRRDIAY
jgi:hypothetical protein